MIALSLPTGAPPGARAIADSSLQTLQPSCGRVLPSSHCSPFVVSTTPLPQVSVDAQFAEQPSPEVLLPSSQTSPLRLSKMPSPQRCARHVVRHAAFAAFELPAPASHCSPNAVSMIESPHFCG